jgi:hypothetical protein
MKLQERVVVLNILIPNLGARWRLLVSATFRLLYALEVTLVRIVKVLWTPRPARTGMEKRQIYCCPVFEPHIFQSVAGRYTLCTIPSLKCKFREKFRIFVVKHASTILVTIRVV